ncbi:MAG: phosphonate ABC transporter, permease protein PhnE [Chloroflexi bacterium]|nr:phosphonate ABC transporter, permease protein PhnE [Chloroflexota bacterium]
MSITRTRPDRPSRVKRDLALLVVVLVFLWATVGLGFKIERLVDLPASLGHLIGSMLLPPAWDYVGEAMSAMLVSIQIAWIGTLIGAVLSLPFGFFAAHNVSPRPVSVAIRVVLDAIRAVPELVLLLVVFVPVAGLGPFPAALAIGVHSVGTLGKLTAEAIESIDPGPVEAARASGASSLQVQRWGVLPQVLPEVVAFWLYRFEINIRAASVLGIVGAGGVGAQLTENIRYGRYSDAGMVIVVVIVATILIDAVSGRVRRRIIEGPGSSGPPSALEEPEHLVAEPASRPSTAAAS